MSPFRRDGHLSDLALDIHLDGGSLDETDAHLAECGLCRQRVTAADAVELPALELPRIPLAASLGTPPVAPAPANRSWIWGAVAFAAAALLVAGVASRGTGLDDGIRVRGSGLSLQVFRDAGDHSERLRSGDEISAGDRLGFRVRNRRPGHLLVIGIDAADSRYVCYPQDQGGTSIGIDASPTPTPLPEAIRMDATPGSERLVAALCDAPIEMSELVDALDEGREPEGCVLDEMSLVKR